MFKDKTDLIFTELEHRTKLFIANPFTIGSLKPDSKYVENYQELYQEEYLDLKRKYGKKFDSHRLLQSVKISWFSHFYIFLIMITNVLGISILVILQTNTQYGMLTFQCIICALICYFPQIAVYFCLVLQDTDAQLKNRIWRCTKIILGLPILALMGLILFILPIKTEQLPFMPLVRETWLHNFFSTGYVRAVKQSLVTFWIYTSYIFIFKGKGYDKGRFPNPEDTKNITDPSSSIRLLFYLAFISFIFITIQTIFYIFEQYHIGFLKNQKQKTREKSEKQNTFYHNEQQQQFKKPLGSLQQIPEKPVSFHQINSQPLIQNFCENCQAQKKALEIVKKKQNTAVPIFAVQAKFQKQSKNTTNEEYSFSVSSSRSQQQFPITSRDELYDFEKQQQLNQNTPYLGQRLPSKEVMSPCNLNKNDQILTDRTEAGKDNLKNQQIFTTGMAEKQYAPEQSVVMISEEEEESAE